jgi:hypothetical protein
VCAALGITSLHQRGRKTPRIEGACRGPSGYRACSAGAAFQYPSTGKRRGSALRAPRPMVGPWCSVLGYGALG